MRHSRQVLTAVLVTLFLHTGCDSRRAKKPTDSCRAERQHRGCRRDEVGGSGLSLNDRAASPNRRTRGRGRKAAAVARPGPSRALPLAIQPQGRRALVLIGSYLSVLTISSRTKSSDLGSPLLLRDVQ